jgi:hypothetical protein
MSTMVTCSRDKLETFLLTRQFESENMRFQVLVLILGSVLTCIHKGCFYYAYYDAQGVRVALR